MPVEHTGASNVILLDDYRKPEPEYREMLAEGCCLLTLMSRGQLEQALRDLRAISDRRAL